MPAERGTVVPPTLEIAGVVVAMLGLVWQPWNLWRWPAPWPAITGTALAALLAVSLLHSWWRVRDGRRRLGLAPVPWTAGLRSLGGFTLAGVAVLAAFGWQLGTMHFEVDRLRWAARYVLGLIGQQVLLQCFLNNRLYDLSARVAPRQRVGFTVVIAASVFATLHLPNLALVASTALASACWVWHFRRHANLWLLCVSHLILGGAAMLMLGKGPLLGLRVGYGAWKKLHRD